VLWKLNDLVQHAEEVKTFIQNQKVDIILISETHFTKKSYIKIPYYSIYDTQHSDVTAHGGTAIITKNGIKHHFHGHYNLEHLQATSVNIEDWIGPLTLAAVCCPPKHAIKSEQHLSFYATLGQRFLAGGDYNAKHCHWGSRLITPKRRVLFKVMQTYNLSHVSIEEPN
jgi:exonuclease III